MAIPRVIKTIERGAVPRKFRKAHTPASRSAWMTTAVEHHKSNRAKRFTEAGGRELRFRRRSAKYVRAKRRKFNHNRPNVWSGDTERKTRRQVRVSATARLGRLAYGPTNLNYHPRYAAEFRSISQKEADQLSRVWGNSYDTEFEKAANAIP